MDASLGLVPVKLIQLFVDPCYLSLCSISDYSTGGGAGTNKDFWSLPLAVQLPALVLLPLCLGGVAYLFVRALQPAQRQEYERRKLDGERQAPEVLVRSGAPARAVVGDRAEREVARINEELD